MTDMTINPTPRKKSLFIPSQDIQYDSKTPGGKETSQTFSSTREEFPQDLTAYFFTL
jgi:hypothetical protein